MPAGAHERERLWNPLSAKQIRLLRIDSEPSALLLRCTLQPFFITQAPPWRALSYVWDTNDANMQIQVNDIVLVIRENLHAALIALNKHVKQDQRPLWLWIDAICINQEDDEEKSLQIPMMDVIYSRAQSVLVWIQEDRVNVRAALTTLEWLDADARAQLTTEENADTLGTSVECCSGACADDPAALQDLTIGKLRVEHDFTLRQIEMLRSAIRDSHGTHKSWNHEDELLKALGKELAAGKYEFWTAIFALLTNAWFERMWTYQEIVLARHADLVHSHGIVCWSAVQKLSRAARHLFTPFYFGLDHAQLVAWKNIGMTYKASLPLLAFGASSTGQPPGGRKLRSILEQTSTRKASVAKDKILGLLGLLSNDDSRAIMANSMSAGGYGGASTRDVFHAAVLVVALQDATDLPALWIMFEQMHGETPGLASWCPDFAGSLWSDAGQSGSTLCLSDAVYDKFCHSASVKLDVALDILSIKILMVDCVIKTAPLTGSRYTPREARLDTVDLEPESMFSLLFSSPKVLYWVQSLADLHSPLVMQNFLNHLLEAVDSSLHSFENLAYYCGHIAHHDCQTAESARQTMQISIQEQEQLTFDMWRTLFCLSHLHVFGTQAGRVGFSYKPVEHGDHVVMVPGGRALVALDEDLTKFRGTVYVHGLEGDRLLNVPLRNVPRWTTAHLA